jgi:hypothetical protein
MALVNDPDSLSEPVLDELVRSLAGDLDETVEMVEKPRGRVLDPASLVTARELLESARAVLRRPGPRSKAERAAEANLAYATLIAVIDLVKTHTDVPRVPPPR